MINTEFNYRNCNDELAVKLIGKLTLEMPTLEVDLPKQLDIKRIIEETIYNYEVTSKETGLVTSDLEGKLNYFFATKKLEGASPMTIKNYRYALNRFQRFFNKPVSTITAADIKMFMYSEIGTKNECSMNTFMTPVKLFFAWLQNEEFIVKNPCANIKPVKEPVRVRKPLNEEQVEMLRDIELTKREKAIIEFFLSTGCRVGEVSKVKIKDIDFEHKTLLVIGKGNKERRVYFTERAKRAIKNYLNERTDDSPYLFVSTKAPYGKLLPKSYQVIVRDLKNRANIDMKVTPHTFRHTFATFALRSGMKPEVIQTILGHNDVGLTLKVYAKLAQTEVEYSYRKLIS